MSNEGKNVKCHYIGTLDDGTKFDSSYDRGEPIPFICMGGMMIKGVDEAVRDMEVGQTINVHIPAEDAYGAYDPEKVHRVPFSNLPGAEKLEVGSKIMLSNGLQQIACTVKDKTADAIVIDMNHEMAGKDLNFEITLVEVN